MGADDLSAEYPEVVDIFSYRLFRQASAPFKIDPALLANNPKPGSWERRSSAEGPISLCRATAPHFALWLRNTARGGVNMGVGRG